MIDPYAALGVSPRATQAEIGHAYRRQLRAHHPDTRPATSAVDDERFQQILAAYALLRDPHRRAEHDRSVSTSRLTRTDPDMVPETVWIGSDVGEHPPLRVGPLRWHRRY